MNGWISENLLNYLKFEKLLNLKINFPNMEAMNKLGDTWGSNPCKAFSFVTEGGGSLKFDSTLILNTIVQASRGSI